MLTNLLSNWFTLIGATATVGVCTYALWRGERPERLTGGAALVAWAATLAVFNRSDLINPQAGILIVDVAFLAFLGWIAFSTGRMWASFATAFQFLTVLSHLAITLDLRIRVLAYLTALALWAYLVLGALLVGTIAVHRRRKLHPHK